VSHKSNLPNASWLPKLESGTRFRNSGLETAAAADTQTWSSALEAQFGLITTPALADAPPAETSADEVQALRDQLAYYQHFDDLIRDNVARSAELFRAAFAAKTEANPEPTAASDPVMVAVEVEQRVAAERVHMQHVLMSLMDEATYMQQRSDVLIQRLAEALTELSLLIPDEDEPVAGA